MSDKKRPDVTGKGPTLIREMLEVFKEIESSGKVSETVRTELSQKSEELQKIIKMAFLKTVKAGEMAWDCKEMALELKAAADSGDSAKVTEISGKLIADLNELIHRIKTFVVRMT